MKIFLTIFFLTAVSLPTGYGNAEDKNDSGLIHADFFEADVRQVLKQIAQVSGKNFVIDDDVRGKVTLIVEQPVPWEQALDVVLKMNRLDKEYFGDTTIRIYRLP